MKKIITLFLISVSVSLRISAQTDGVQIDYTVTPPARNASAILELNSAAQGVLVPRMASVASVTSPVTGLLVYQTGGTPGFYYYNGSAWVLISNTTSNLSGVTAGTGLTGGGTSGTITVNAVGDNGLTTNADDIDLGGNLTQAATTITQDGSETFSVANTGSGNTTINLSSTGDFEVQDAGSPALFVRDDAFVGVGTNAPNSPLSVRTTVATANARTSSLANAIGDGNFELVTSKGATSNGSGDIMTQIGQAYNGGTIAEGIQFIRGTGSTDGAMAFVTNAGTERMRILSNGYIGIGTNNPARTLEVNGTIYNRGLLQQKTSDGQGSGAHGISWYDPSFVTWYDYMAPPGTTNSPSGTAAPQDATTGITSWARRFNMESIGSYGWLFESGVNTAGSAPTVKFAINAGTGNFHTIGNGYIDGTLKIAGGSPGLGKVLVSDATGLASWVTMAGSGYGDNLGNHTATQALGMAGFAINNAEQINSVGDHLEIMRNRTDDASYEWQGFYSGATRQGIILYDGAWTGANNIANEFSITAESGNMLTLNTESGRHVAIMPKGTGNVGVGTLNPAQKLEVNGNIYNRGILYQKTSDGQGSGAHGINWYDPSYVTWYDYMAPGGGTNAPNGAAAPTDAGSGVTSWSRRFNIENAGGYGWIFESGLNDATAPTVKFSINSNNGTFHGIGNGYIDGNVGVGTTSANQRLILGANGGLGFAGTSPALNSADKKLYSPGDGDLEWMTHNSAGVHGFAVSHQGTKAVYLNSSGNSYFIGGNVGFGTTGPGESIHSTGNIRADGIVYWGNGLTRTETRDDAGTQGGRSGFYETSVPAPSANWYSGASSWQHLLETRHSNTGNNYAMQFAGSFFDQDIYARKTNNSASTAWGRVITSRDISYVKAEYYGVSGTKNAWVTVTGVSPWMDVKSGDKIKLDGMYYGRLTTGSNNEYWTSRVQITGQNGCGTNYSNHHDYWHVDEGGGDHDNFKPVVYMDVWECNCTGQIRFEYQIYMSGDDNWEAREIIITGTRY